MLRYAQSPNRARPVFTVVTIISKLKRTKLFYYTSLILRVQTLLLSSVDEDDKTLPLADVIITMPLSLELIVTLSLLMSTPAAAAAAAATSVSVATVTSERIEKLCYRRDSARLRSLRHSKSFKVTDFGTKRKLVYHFLLANILQPISYSLQFIPQA